MLFVCLFSWRFASAQARLTSLIKRMLSFFVGTMNEASCQPFAVALLYGSSASAPSSIRRFISPFILAVNKVGSLPSTVILGSDELLHLNAASCWPLCILHDRVRSAILHASSRGCSLLLTRVFQSSNYCALTQEGGVPRYIERMDGSDYYYVMLR